MAAKFYHFRTSLASSLFISFTFSTGIFPCWSESLLLFCLENKFLKKSTTPDYYFLVFWGGLTYLLSFFGLNDMTLASLFLSSRTYDSLRTADDRLCQFFNSFYRSATCPFFLFNIYLQSKYSLSSPYIWGFHFCSTNLPFLTRLVF